jgi:hypothetical protein
MFLAFYFDENSFGLADACKHESIGFAGAQLQNTLESPT